MTSEVENNAEQVDILKNFKNEKMFLLFVGLYPYRSKSSTILYFLYWISGFLTVSVGCAQFLSMLIRMILDISDLSKVSETLFFFITHSTYMCKMINFLIYRNNLLEIENDLKRPIFNNFRKDCLQLLNAKIKSAKKLNIFFQLLCLVAVTLQAFGPYFDKNNKNTLPLAGWQPYDVTMYFFPTAIFQFLALFYTCANNVTFDTLTWTLVALASGEFDILKTNLKNINYKSGKIKQIEEQLNNCIKHHNEALKYVYKIESTFSKGIFLTFLASVVVICFTGFMMILVPFMGLQFIFLALYLSCMLTEVAVYCWRGHDVMTTSEEIGSSFYMSNWYQGHSSVYRNMLIFMERTKKPVVLSGGKLVVLSLSTLTAILRSSYSYFAVLQHLNDS